MLEYAIYYGIGAAAYAVVLGMLGEGLSPAKLFGVVIWPLATAHLVGQVIRRLLSLL